MSLPTDRAARNALPVWDGCLAYFPDVWAEIAKVSVAGNTQHGLGDKLHWDTTVSTDHQNKVVRHMLDDASGEVFDVDGTMHLAKAMWRIAAALQLRCWERDGKDAHGRPKAPVSPTYNAHAQAWVSPEPRRCVRCFGPTPPCIAPADGLGGWCATYRERVD